MVEHIEIQSINLEHPSYGNFSHSMNPITSATLELKIFFSNDKPLYNMRTSEGMLSELFKFGLQKDMLDINLIWDSINYLISKELKIDLSVQEIKEAIEKVYPEKIY